MKVLLICLTVVALCGVCNGIDLSAKLKETADKFKTTTKNIGTDLKAVGSALVDLAKQKAKDVAGQTLQALFGAFSDAFKGFNPGKILVGKRTTHHDFIWQLILNTTEHLNSAFDETFQQFDDVIDSLREIAHPVTKFNPENVKMIADSHHMAVRGIIGDTLNKAIDKLRDLYYGAKEKLVKAKNALLGGSSSGKVVSDPVMVGRRGLITDAWNSFSKKVDSIKKTAYQHLRGTSEVVNHMSNMLGHYGRKMVDHVKNDAVSKVQETFGNLRDNLTEHLENIKDSLEPFRQQVSEALLNIIHSDE